MDILLFPCLFFFFLPPLTILQETFCCYISYRGSNSWASFPSSDFSISVFLKIIRHNLIEHRNSLYKCVFLHQWSRVPTNCPPVLSLELGQPLLLAGGRTCLSCKAFIIPWPFHTGNYFPPPMHWLWNRLVNLHASGNLQRWLRSLRTQRQDHVNNGVLRKTTTYLWGREDEALAMVCTFLVCKYVGCPSAGESYVAPKPPSLNI